MKKLILLLSAIFILAICLTSCDLENLFDEDTTTASEVQSTEEETTKKKKKTTKVDDDEVNDETTENKTEETTKADFELYLWNDHVTDNRANAIFVYSDSSSIFPDHIKWEPGITHIAYLSIKNTSRYTIEYKIALTATNTTKNHLTDVVLFDVIDDVQFGYITTWSEKGATIADGKLNFYTDQSIELKPNEEHFFAIALHMSESAGNYYMNASADFGISIITNQSNNNTPGIGESENTYTFVELDQTVKVYALTAINLRERPSFAADVAKKSVPAGTELVKIAESNESSIDSNENEYKWFKVIFEDKEYYVKSNLVTTISDPGKGFTETAKTLYAKGNLKVRSVPDLDTEAVGNINQGDAIKIVGVNEEDGWYQIEFEGKYTPKGVYYVVSDAKWWSETPIETDAE